VPLNLDTRFAPREIGVLRRRQAPLSAPAERFLHHLMTQLRQCQDSSDAMLQRVFRSIDLSDDGT
jgi:LysR family transcriptional regulator of abg operon